MQSPIWFETLSEAERSLLQQSDPLPRAADVAIAGAGMIGLAAAYYLSAAGITGICVIDRKTALSEASGANAGGLWFAREAADAGPLTALFPASDRLFEELASTPGFQFDFRRTGVLELLGSEARAAEADARVARVAEAGFRAERAGPADLARIEPGLCGPQSGALVFPDDAQLNPAKLGACLVRCLKNNGVTFCFNTEVSRIETNRITTSRGTIGAGAIVIAAGAWTPLITDALGWAPPIKPMRGQLLATAPRAPLLRHTVLGERYYYWQIPEGHIIAGGTVEDAGFERRVDPRDLASIREEMGRLFPELREAPVSRAWCGFRPYCEGSNPVVGRVPGCENVYVAAGHFRKGIMLAPITGKILAGLIAAGRSEMPIDALDPARF